MLFHQKTLHKTKNLLQNHLGNRVRELNNLQIFEDVVIGYANATDKLFASLKEPEIVGNHYLLPRDWLVSSKTVISFFFSFSKRVRLSNKAGIWSSTEWLYARREGQQFLNAFAYLVVNDLYNMGERSVIPTLDPMFNLVGLRSNWSERHTGYICGLGTFGLSESLITDLGSAGRMISIITTLEVPPTARTYNGIYDNCLWHHNNSCGACLQNCPPQAILSDGSKNKALCSRQIDLAFEKFSPRDGCGKCQAGMPCEQQNPMKRRKKS